MAEGAHHGTAERGHAEAGRGFIKRRFIRQELLKLYQLVLGPTHLLRGGPVQVVGERGQALTDPSCMEGIPAFSSQC